MSYDAIVLGGGPNGLAAAVRLGSAGRKVLLVERRATLGGLSGTIEFHPGYRVPGLLHDDGLVSPRVAARLGLEGHGLAFADAPPVYLAEADGRGVLLARDPARNGGELDAHDAAAYAAYRGFMTRLAPLVERLMTSPPPPLSPAGFGEYREIARHGLAVWKLGRAETLEVLRVAPMCVADFLQERFRSPLVVAGLAAPAVLGTWAGPWSAGTNTNLILAEAAPGRPVAGGPAALVAALESAARAVGVEIRTGCEVSRLRLGDDGRVEGVVLDGGEAIDAARVVATCDPKRALLGLVEPGALPVRLEEEFRRLRMRGTAAKIHLALSGPFELAARPGERFAAVRVGGGHVDALERAFDAVKYRHVSDDLQLEIRVPTVDDPALAPAGHHVVSIVAGYAPFDLEGGWSAERNARLLAQVLATLEPHAPALRSRLVASQVLSPFDLEREYAVTGGQLHHGEPALDQLFVMRPAPSAARYATPVPGLFL
ncbi:MAG: NAD(P)/FAD-dependent oxidoreductase, partial [Thermoanaerobaculia bacterium]|nr:NAD(P)/FAD-dependent oxidoreductase [Thermoanaerobaculia bacterium]